MAERSEYVPSIFDRDLFPFPGGWDWPLAMWSGFRTIEEEMDRKFKHFEQLMERDRQRALKAFKDAQKPGELTQSTYSKHSSHIENKEIVVDGH